jgi:hypothetical protein
MKALVIWIAVLAVLVGPGLVRAGMPRQGNLDMVSCGDTRVTLLVADEGLVVMDFESRGINLDNLPGKAWDNLSYHFAGVSKIEKGKVSGLTYAKYMDPGGDTFVVDIWPTNTGSTWKFAYGTGKYKGIAGEGKTVRTPAKPILPGTSQECYRITGTYELKEQAAR